MHIVVLSGSPRKNGNTAIMVEAFKEGAESAGNTVEVLGVGSMKIAGCKACRYCFEHDGACVNDDDMTDVYNALKKADMMVLASPVYWFDVTSQLKCAIDRLYAFGGPGFSFSKVALLLNSQSPNVYTAATAAYKDMNAYLKWEDQGIITICGMEEKGSMADSSELPKVREFGASLKQLKLV